MPWLGLFLGKKAIPSNAICEGSELKLQRYRAPHNALSSQDGFDIVFDKSREFGRLLAELSDT